MSNTFRRKKKERKKKKKNNFKVQKIIITLCQKYKNIIFFKSSNYEKATVHQLVNMYTKFHRDISNSLGVTSREGKRDGRTNEPRLYIPRQLRWGGG